jgi:poly(U)-specific endoribonuclease
VQHLWDLDFNRLQQGIDFAINVQEGKKPYQKDDEATYPLFTSLDQRQIQSRPTYRTFCALLDNYTMETGEKESNSDKEKAEVRAFLQAIMETAPMQFCHKYCVANGEHIPSDKEGFISLLQSIWFDLYGRSRGGPKDSSGFEHVFVGEVKEDKVSGFHNWIQLYLEEKKGSLDYRGYIKPRGQNEASTNDDDRILTLQFTWNGYEKSVGSSFIGTSPEFEMALYTTCFLVGGEENQIQLDTGIDVFTLNIRCYRMGSMQIGTSFPEASSHYEE